MRAGIPRDDRLSRRELGAALLLFVLSVGVRLAFVLRFPTLPVSDFRGLVAFGLHLRDHGLAAPGWFWMQFNPGMPMILSTLFRLAPSGSAAALARTATVVWTGLLPLLPFLLWRGFVAFAFRVAAAALLALWPGQVFFSGVVAQDNWVLVPAVALACLAARRLLDPASRTHAVAAGLLYAAAIAIRQEMLFVLLPVLFAASLSRDPRRLAREVVFLLLAGGLPLGLLAVQRGRATGRYTVTTEHTGLALLGSFVPGAFAAGWIDPRPWLAATNPSLLENPKLVQARAGTLALAEARRRPRFHLARVGVESLRLAMQSDAENLFWSVGAPSALPPDRAKAAELLLRRVKPALFVQLGLIQGAFLAALAVAVARRDAAVLVVSASALAKLLLHAIASPMSRLMLPATALELVAIGLALPEWPRLSRRFRTAIVLVAIAAPLALSAAIPRLEKAVLERDPVQASSYRFPLDIAGVRKHAWCDVDRGRLQSLEWSRAAIVLGRADPEPGDTARAVCTLPPVRAGESLVLRVEDRYGPGGFPGRVVERVELDGREVLRHDVAAQSFAGWLEIPVADDRSAPGRRVTFEILAVAPDRGWGWGSATSAGFELVRRPPP